jgi:hypothetical protein
MIQRDGVASIDIREQRTDAGRWPAVPNSPVVNASSGAHTVVPA